MIIALVLIGLAIVVWLIGSIILRGIGWFFILLGGTGLFFIGDYNSVAAYGYPGAFLSIGILSWLAGHWIFAQKHHYYNSDIARRFWGWLAGGRFDTTRNYGYVVHHVHEDPKR